MSFLSYTFSSIPASFGLSVFGIIVIGLLIANLVILLRSRGGGSAAPGHDQLIENAEREASQILEDARMQRRSMRAQVEEETEKAFASRREGDEEFQKEQVKHLEELTAHAQSLLSKQTTNISHLSEEMAGNFKKQAVAMEEALADEAEIIKKALQEETEHIRGTFADVGKDLHNDYQALIAETKRKLTEELETEIQAARDAVIAYRNERLALLNREIVALVEDTARIALGKTLSFNEHRDIIMNALEEARREGVFAE